jgi:alpha-D-xyloside xylohydrolase
MQDFGEQVVADMHFHDGTTGVTMHNRLATLAHRATRQAVDAFQHAHPGRHIWFYTRAGHSGRPGAAAYEGGNFPGDETTDWTRSSGLASLTTDMLNRAIGGAFGFTADIGGFFDVGPYQATTKELFIRWTEWAALSPFFRVHGSVGAGTHTPWSYGPETLRIFKRYATLHRRAAPLIRRLWREARRTGIPPTRPLWLAAPGDARAAAQDQEWMLGDDLIVAPVVIRAAVSRDVYLPAGCWQRDGRGRRLTGRRTVTAEAALGQLPWFVRCGTRPLA